MPICITCSTPVKNLYTTYSKADDRSLGKGVRLTQCPNCKRFADKYVEHDYVVLFIDLVLIKPQVYRHLLFNRLYSPSDKLDPSILRLGILLILFDVYITWARIERANSPLPSPLTSTTNPYPQRNFNNAPIITQYLFFLTLNIVATLVQHGVIRLIARWLITSKQSDSTSPSSHVRSHSSPMKGKALSPIPGPNQSQATLISPNPGAQSTATAWDETTPAPWRLASPLSARPSQPSLRPSNTPIDASPLPFPDLRPQPQAPAVAMNTRPGSHTSPSAISTALLVSSCTKLFPILLVIWPTSTSSSDTTTANTSISSALGPFAHRATSYIGWVVLLNNIEALLILLDCGYVLATGLAVSGLLGRWVVEGWLLSAVGLVREVEGPVGDVVALVCWVCGWG